jgi:protein-disulfide isomerase
MRVPSRRLALAVAATLLATAASAAPPPAPAPTPTPATVSKFTAPEYVMGNPKAKVTLVEYASASCPHCARFDAQVFPAVKAKYIDTGKVKYVFREFLTPPEEIAAAGFLLARCTGQQHYFHVVEQVFAAQPEIYASNDPKSVFVRIAKGYGIDEKGLDACLNDQAATDALNARLKQAIDVQKIDSTPTFLVNGVKLDEHGKEPDLALFDAAIQPLLKKHR